MPRQSRPSGGEVSKSTTHASNPFPPNASVLALDIGDATYFVIHWPELAPADAGLTAAEAEVLEMLSRGCSNSTIAAKRQVSQRTVANQVQSIFRKLGISSRRDLLARKARY
jgi:DNA-binding CsgD family transcriptional regulator